MAKNKDKKKPAPKPDPLDPIANGRISEPGVLDAALNAQPKTFQNVNIPFAGGKRSDE